MISKTIVRGIIDTEPKTVRIDEDDLTVTSFSLRVTNKFRNRNNEIVKEESFFDVELFGNVAEETNGQYKKGDKVICSGRLHLENVKDENGRMCSKVFLITTSISQVY